MKPVLVFDMKTMKPCAEMPMGLTGQISFRRLIEQLDKAGEFKQGETVTHIAFHSNGMMTFTLTQECAG